MAFCTQCGARLEEGAKFCTVCGAKQPEPAAPAAPVYTPPAAGQPCDSAASRPANAYDPTIYSAGQQGAVRKKSNLGKVIGIILAVAAVIAGLAYVFATRSGGAKSERAEDLGLYVAQKAELKGISVDINAMWKDGFSIDLQKGGKCRVNVDGEKGNAKWSKDEDDSFRLKGSGIDCSGTLRNGVLVLEDVMGSGIELTFTKDGAPLPEKEDVPVAAPAPDLAQAETKDEGDPVLGVYTAERAEAMGIEVSIADIWEKGVSIELLDGGKCNFNFNGAVSKAKWTLDGENFTLDDGTSFHGTLRDGVLTLENIAGMGATLYFTKDGAALHAPAPESGTVQDSEYDSWAGDYYGYWTAYEVNGKFAESGNYRHGYWDTCATIEVYGDRGYIRIWDEDGDNVAASELRFGPGLTDKGSMTTTDGYFYASDLTDGSWVVDPGMGMFRDFEGFLVISGRYYEPEGSENWIDYYIFLRPWGMDWEDILYGDMSEMIYDDMMPRHYKDWYMPLVEAGKPMPADFDGLVQDR